VVGRVGQTLLEIDELLKYVDRAEAELQSAEYVSADSETLALQLAQHKASVFNIIIIIIYFAYQSTLCNYGKAQTSSTDNCP